MNKSENLKPEWKLKFGKSDNPVLSILLTFQDDSKLVFIFKEPVNQGEVFASLGSMFGKLKIPMPDLFLPEEEREA